MYILGTLCAIGAGIFFGFIGPVTKVAYNLGVGLGLAILLRYLIATILITPFIIVNRPSLNMYKNQIWLLLILTSGSKASKLIDLPKSGLSSKLGSLDMQAK